MIQSCNQRMVGSATAAFHTSWRAGASLLSSAMSSDTLSTLSGYNLVEANEGFCVQTRQPRKWTFACDFRSPGQYVRDNVRDNVNKRGRSCSLESRLDDGLLQGSREGMGHRAFGSMSQLSDHA